MDARPRSSGHFAPVLLAVALLAFLFVPASTEAPDPVIEIQPEFGAPTPQNLLAGLPSRFEPNVGQAGDGIAYTLKAKGYLASLSSNAIYFALPEGKQPMSLEDRLQDPKTNPAPAQRAVVTMSFVGANSNPSIEALDPQEGVSNYFLGNDPSKWRTNVSGYSKIYYRDLYDGINMVIYDDSGQVRYDFIVAPGADPNQIEIAFEGAEDLKVSDTGDLVVSSPYGDLTHKAPFSYQGAQEIGSSFEIREGHAGFSLSAYDRTLELTIDPSLVYSSYLGGSDRDEGESIAVAVDSTGAAYVTGWTHSTDFPTASAFQGTIAGISDAFVTKVASDGGSLDYSSYLGGSDVDGGFGIVVDSTGAAYVTGITQSTDFPTASAFQGTIAGISDAFVTKVASDGGSLDYSSYLGGSDWDGSFGIAVDSTGAAYVTGITQSTDFPTASAFQGSNAGLSDAFVTKVAPDGGSLDYSSYLGSGSSWDHSRGIAVDSTGAAYVTGETAAPDDFPTVSSFQGTNAGSSDAFVTKVAPDGGSLDYSSYLGGSDVDHGRGIAVDSTGSAYVTGISPSTDFPTASAFQGTNAGLSDAFVTKVAPDGGSLDYSSYLGGGSGDDDGRGIAVDSTGAAYVTGITQSTDFPTVSALQGTNAGTSDAFVTKVAPDGGSLDYSSYLGGSDWDGSFGIAVDSTGAAYVTGYTNSIDFPTALPSQETNSGGWDALLTKIAPSAMLSGTFTNSNGSRVSVYRTSDGAQVATGFTSPIGEWSLVAPESINCPTSGYKIYAEAPAGYQPRWYNDKDNYSEADCIDAPNAGLTMTLPPSVTVEGDITDSATGLPVDGAIVYAFRSDGRFSNWVQSGSGGTPGHFKLDLAAGQSYRLLVVHGNMQRWFGDSENFTGAADCVAPCTANLSIAASSPIEGYVKTASTASDLNGVPIYVWNSSTGQFAGWTLTGMSAPGRYSLNLPTGGSYKVLAHPGIAHEDLWSDGAPGYVEASPAVPPATANFSLREAALITGTATASGGGPMPNGLVAAYTTCGCSTPQVAITGSDGSYAVKVASTAASGWQYRVRFISPSYETSWYSDSTSFGGSTPVSAPSGGINQQTPA